MRRRIRAVKITIEIAGWTGTGLILLAYFLLSASYLDANASLYQLMNLAGVIGVALQVGYKRIWSALILQIAWGMIASWSLCGIWGIR